MFTIPIFVHGMFGVFALNIVLFFKRKHLPISERQKILSDPMYEFLCLPLIGGYMAYLYQGNGIYLTPMLAANIGIAAPVLLESLASIVPQNLRYERIN